MADRPSSRAPSQPIQHERHESRAGHETGTVTTERAPTRAELIEQAIANIGPQSGGNDHRGAASARFCADRLRARRHLSGLTSGQLAGRVRLPAEMVDRFETGALVPSPRHVAALCRVLGCAPRDLAPTGDPAGEYWDALCAALPPLTGEQVTAVAAVLNRTPTTPPRE